MDRLNYFPRVAAQYTTTIWSNLQIPLVQAENHLDTSIPIYFPRYCLVEEEAWSLNVAENPIYRLVQKLKAVKAGLEKWNTGGELSW